MKPKRRLTSRQRMWADAAATELEHGNALTAGLFHLIAQPSAKEAAAARRCPDCGEPGERAGHMGCQYPQDRP